MTAEYMMVHVRTSLPTSVQLTRFVFRASTLRQSTRKSRQRELQNYVTPVLHWSVRTIVACVRTLTCLNSYLEHWT